MLRYILKTGLNNSNKQLLYVQRNSHYHMISPLLSLSSTGAVSRRNYGLKKGTYEQFENIDPKFDPKAPNTEHPEDRDRTGAFAPHESEAPGLLRHEKKVDEDARKNDIDFDGKNRDFPSFENGKDVGMSHDVTHRTQALDEETIDRVRKDSRGQIPNHGKETGETGDKIKSHGGRTG